MIVDTPVGDEWSRPSLVIAEALVRREGPSEVALRAAQIGCSRPLTNAMIVACAATAVDRCKDTEDPSRSSCRVAR